MHIPDNRTDPTVIPSSSLIGFLERFPWRFGAKGVKYRPSAADLQEHPGSMRRYAQEDEPLMEATEDDADHSPNGRYRSATQSSRGTTNSLSSRGDLFPSDDEEDAVPLDDEFALAFGRRGTGLESDDQSGTKSEMVRSASGTSSLEGASSKKSKRKKKRSSTKSPMSADAELVQSIETPSIAYLKIEEERAAREEEAMVERNRLAAQELAMKRGLDQANADMVRNNQMIFSRNKGANMLYSLLLYHSPTNIQTRGLPRNTFPQQAGTNFLKVIPGNLVVHHSDGFLVTTLNPFHPSHSRHLMSQNTARETRRGVSHLRRLKITHYLFTCMI